MNFREVWIEWFLAACIIAIVVAFFVSMNEKAKEQDAFMAACTKDHKAYECVAMWRAGNSRDIYIPLILPSSGR